LDCRIPVRSSKRTGRALKRFAANLSSNPQNKSGKIIPEQPKLNAPDDQKIRKLWADFLTSIKEKATGSRHRNWSPSNQHELSRDALAQDWQKCPMRW
jgi:hypothetical protein